MGEQHSKTNTQKQSTDCQTESSSSSIQQETLTEFISSSPQKLQQISRIHQISTSCFLKYSSNKDDLDGEIQSEMGMNTFQKVLERIRSTYEFTAQQDHQSLDQNPSQNSYQLNPDLDRIDSLFQRNKFRQNYTQFQQDLLSQEEGDQILILNWKNSVNKIINLTTLKCQYVQGYLLICAVMRLYLTQQGSFNFLNRLLQKVSTLMSSHEEYTDFSHKLQAKFRQFFPKTFQKLQQKELDFQSIYANWILGLFSATLSKQSCIKVWYQLSICEQPLKKLQEIIIQFMKMIEKFITNMQKDNLQLDENCFHNSEIQKILYKFQVDQQHIWIDEESQICFQIEEIEEQF